MLEFATEQLNPDTVIRDEKGQFSPALWHTCAEFGIQSMSVPAKYNHSQTDTPFLQAMLAMEAMGYGCKDNGLTFALNAQMWTVQLPILEVGSEAQKQKFLPPMTAGQLIGSHAMTEPQSGSDVYSLQTQAEKVEGGYLLNGEKCLIYPRACL